LTALFWNKKAHKQAFFTVGFTLFSFLAVCPGFYFRYHYFLLLLPAVALLAGVGVNCLYTLVTPRHFFLTAKLKPLLLILILLFYPLYQQRKYLFTMSPTAISRTTYRGNPFVESLEIARYIRENSTEDDQIVVLGSEPQIYFYANRHSATSHMYTHLLMGPYDVAAKFQKEMITEIESAKPKFLVFVGIPISWLLTPSSEKLIFTWYQKYLRKYYERVGIIDIYKDGNNLSLWDEESIGYTPQSRNWISVYRRKNSQSDNEQ